MRDIQLFELLSLIHRRLHRLLAPIFQAEGLSGAEIVVLWKINKVQRCRVSDLSEEMGIPPSTITGTLDRLESKGWLKRMPDPGDRRGIIVRGTPRIAQFTCQMLDRIGKEMQAVFGILPQENYDRLISDLKMICDHLQGEKGDAG